MSFLSGNDSTKMVEENISSRHTKTDATRASDDINSEIYKNSHRNLVSTQNAVASSSGSEENTRFDIEGGVKRNSDMKSSKDVRSEYSPYVERGLQRHLSQTDDHIQLLDRNGDLNEVAGSQSMLSQELIDQHHSHDNSCRLEGSCGSVMGSCILGDLISEEESQPQSSIGIAKRLGLLTQTEGDDEEESMDVIEQQKLQVNNVSLQLTNPVMLTSFAEAINPEKQTKQTQIEKYDNESKIRSEIDTKRVLLPKNSSCSQGLSERKVKQVPISGLELLTQVGVEEAGNLPSFSASIKSNTKDFSSKHKDKKPSTIAKPTLSRENEGFGSLLDAVAKISEQEASEESSVTWRPTAATALSHGAECKKYSKKRKSTPSTRLKFSSTSKQRKSETQKLKEKLRREKIEQENERAQVIAKKAAMIAERTIKDPIIAKNLLLSMALARENPRSVPQELPGKGHIVQEGFFWAHYPPLELVLKKHMAEYYELSTHQCQSRQQQAFNNYMVDVVKDVAEAQDWAFADSFCDKSLRDRIRCYYKTHIQNAKKRLRTMVRNPTKRANARHLCEHVDLIEKHRLVEPRTDPKIDLSDQNTKK